MTGTKKKLNFGKNGIVPPLRLCTHATPIIICLIWCNVSAQYNQTRHGLCAHQVTFSRNVLAGILKHLTSCWQFTITI